MSRKLLIIWLLILIVANSSHGQVRIRLFAGQSPESAVFSITGGEYELNSFKAAPVALAKGDLVIISKFNGKIAVKTKGSKGFICDSLILSGKTGNDYFSLRINDKLPVRQYYSGDLQCLPDLGTVLFINISNIESYIAGVVNAEGGPGKNIEYFKTQAIIARTFMYKNINKHIADKFNLCDNTHCQAFNGITRDSLIIQAANATKDLIICGTDSALIISAFHSNCGGETSPSEYVWVTGQSYLKKVTDPYCRSSRNATWKKSISFETWIDYLSRSGFRSNAADRSVFNSDQETRKDEYQAGTFSMPFRQIRTDMNLRSAFFSVRVEGDSIVLYGRGYGHGVGLCQEGAMNMADKGFDYKQIINFYYTGVRITDIKNVVNPSAASQHLP